MKEISYQNVKLLQRIVDARQVNFKSRDQLINGIKEGELRVQKSRVASIRIENRKLSRMADENKKIAVKLFTSKPTYQAVDFERQFKIQSQRKHRISRQV
jgi:ribonuclease HII